MPAQMNMNTQVMFEYSGLPLPRRMLPYLLKARYSTVSAQAKTNSWMVVPKVRVDSSNSWLAVCSASAGKAARPTTVSSTAIRLTVIRNTSFLLLLVIIVSWERELDYPGRAVALDRKHA
ncbi:hypothetical protein D9M68_700510 [compost metagenome]